MFLQFFQDVCFGDEAKQEVWDSFDGVLDIESLLAAGHLLDVGLVDSHSDQFML